MGSLPTGVRNRSLRRARAELKVGFAALEHAELSAESAMTQRSVKMTEPFRLQLMH